MRPPPRPPHPAHPGVLPAGRGRGYGRGGAVPHRQVRGRDVQERAGQQPRGHGGLGLLPGALQVTVSSLHCM